MSSRLSAQSERSYGGINFLRSFVGYYCQDIVVAIVPEVSSSTTSKQPNLSSAHVLLAQIDKVQNFSRQGGAYIVNKYSGHLILQV
ncbi:hypothetical protein jaqu_26790 [Jannaschia aquimarina]|uniref:Uncharacterized protein n=1 Tax=Jannaschia aquimarina TaxID=935700 RepID=A0A0D1CL96_9RHOB|nr:hypothetical protein [Jannaschia aquimarina]KIT15582.1 hypothetical protein jaqu_26790 [Jannaschia aquimarina]SNT27257.1 hypothetical protein SAMN05421775_109133 [Jannaschia aquimarina]